jgi:hypothetical protein
MKTLMKFAVGAAIAGALVNMLMKQRSGRGAGMMEGSRDDQPGSEALGSTIEDAAAGAGAGSSGFTVGELVADTNTQNTLSH